MAPDETRDGTAGPVEARDSVPYGCFSLDNVPAGERFGRWRQSISCIFDVEAGREIRNEHFHARLSAHRFGDLLLAHTLSMPQIWRRTERTIARDGMDHYMIQLYDAGAMADETCGRERIFSHDGLIVFDLAQPSTTKTGDFSNLSLILPRELLSPMLRHPDEQHLRMLDGREPLVRLLRGHMISLRQAADDMTMAEALHSNPATIALAAACLNGSAADADTGNREAQIRSLAVRRLVEANLGAPDLSPQMVSEMTGLAATTLGLMFEPAGGFEVYVRDRRLHQARVTLMRQRRLASEALEKQSDPDRRYEDWLQFLAA